MSVTALACCLLLSLLWIFAFGVELCERDEDCVLNGLCLPTLIDKVNNVTGRSCFCPKSCTSSVPVECARNKQCIVEGVQSTLDNRCDKANRLCLCKTPEGGHHACAKANLRIAFFNATRTQVYLGEPFAVTCCVNTEPRSVQLRWFHNDTELQSHQSPDDFQLCWTLNITAARFQDAGFYVCQAMTDLHTQPIVASATVHVRGSRFQAFFESARESGQPEHGTHYLNLDAVRLNGTSVLLNWFSSVPSTGINLRIETLDGGVPVFEAVVDYAAKPHVVGGLQPDGRYSISASTVGNNDAQVLYGKTVINEQIDGVPMPPSKLTMYIEDNIPRTKCLVSWQAPLASTPPVLHYAVDVYGIVRYTDTHSSRLMSTKHRPKSSNCRNPSRVLPSPKGDGLMTCTFDGLLPNHNYSAKVVAVNAVGRGVVSMVENQCLTSYGPPASIETPVAKRGIGDETIDVQFPASADSRYGPITCYFLAVVPCTLNVNFSQLPPPGYMNFEVYERALESNLHIRFQPIFAYIAEAYYELPKSTLIGDGQQVIDGEMTLDFLGRFLPHDGKLERGYKYIGFLIARVDPDKAVYNLSDSPLEKLPSWLQPTYSFSSYFKPVFLGDSVSDLTITEPEKKTYFETMYLVAVGFSVIVIILIFAAVGFYFSHIKGWLKTILCVDSNLVPDRTSFSDLQRVNKCRDFQPTRVQDLPAEYLLRHRDSNFLFTVEFESLPHYSFDTLASDLPDNACKNRYNDIKAFDITRVRLHTDAKLPPPSQSDDCIEEPEPASDYINANYIQGYKGSRLFIAAQGPTSDTVNDFWRLIWEQNVQVVIMVTNLQEKYRTMCIKYWPEHLATVYGDVEVTLVDTTFFSDYVVRIFSVRLVAGGGGGGGNQAKEVYPDESGEKDALLSDCRHQVVQYHYTGWYDYRAPEGSFGFLRFIKEFKQLNLAADVPVLVHCSAGVGRTGTFIAVDGLIDQMADDGHVDVFGYVSNLRRQRNFMVQSLDQYVFIYKALAEWYMFGDTDIEAERIVQHVHALRLGGPPAADGSADRPLSSDAMTKLECEFNKLLLTLEDQPNCDFAHKPSNEPKNRYKTVVPYNHNRVVLAPLFGHDDASYVNASLIRGYLCQYIMTQDPLAATIWDFWRMVIELNVCCIVCLTDEDSLDAAEKYWPAELNHGVSFGDKPMLTIQMVKEERTTCYTYRKLHVTNSKENELRKVIMFAYGDWSATCSAGHSSLPNSTASLFDLVGKVSQRQMQIANAGPVVVHCRDGSERSGLYVAVSLLLERLRREGKIDVFKTVKALQFQRSHVISSLAQYDFCYQCILDYLQSFG